MEMLANSVHSDVIPLGFSWRRALLGKYDLFHVHWPEYLLSMPSRPKQWAARALFSIILIRLAVAGIPIIRTRHNRGAHVSISRVDRFLLRALNYRTVTEIRMNTIPVADLESRYKPLISIIPHGNYIPYLQKYSSAISADRPKESCMRLFCFGILKPYKNFEHVADAVSKSVPYEAARLTIAGFPADRAYALSLSTQAELSDGLVEVIEGRLDDEALIKRIGDSNYIIVPYGDVYNSGVVFLALSLNTPVVLQRSDASEALQVEFGESWIFLYEGNFDRQVISSLSHHYNARLLHRENVVWHKERDWNFVGERLVTVYNEAIV